MQITLSQAAQRLLDALDAALPYAPHRAEFDIVADAADDLRAALKREEKALTQETDMTTLREASQQALEALWHYHATEWGADSPASKAINALQAALKREEETLAWLEERKQHWKRERERMQDPELSAALGYPGGISDPVLNRVELLRMVAEMRLSQLAAPQ